MLWHWTQIQTMVFIDRYLVQYHVHSLCNIFCGQLIRHTAANSWTMCIYNCCATKLLDKNYQTIWQCYRVTGYYLKYTITGNPMKLLRHWGDKQLENIKHGMVIFELKIIPDVYLKKSTIIYIELMFNFTEFI